jgi:hypothetical protein
MKVTACSVNLLFAESAYGQISQADKSEKLQLCCLFVQTAGCSLCIFTLKDAFKGCYLRILLKDAFEGYF